MPRIGFEPENKRANASDYPKLYLDNGERARVLMIETGGKIAGPEVGFAHTLRMPVLVNGQVVMESQQRGKEVVEAPKMEFVGRHVCVGSLDILSQKGVDPDGCPVCAASKESAAVDAPQRRFAMHIIRYKTTAGSFNVQDPFQVDLQAWAFTDMIFGQLVDFAVEWGDMKEHDLLLGPCTNKNYQKFDLNVAGKAEWLASDERKALVVNVYKNNQCQDLTTFIGRKLTRDQIQEDLDKVLLRYKQAYNPGSVDLPHPSDVATALDVDSLLSSEDEPKEEKIGPGGGLLDATSEAQETKPEGDVIGKEELDDLLAGM